MISVEKPRDYDLWEDHGSEEGTAAMDLLDFTYMDGWDGFEDPRTSWSTFQQELESACQE